MSQPASSAPASVPGWRALAAIVVLGLAMRPQLSVVGPILPRVQDEIGLPHAVAGSLTALPLLCMGLAAFLTRHVVERLGAAWTIAVALALIGAAGIGRAGAGDTLSLFATTIGIGIGIGLAGTAAPAFVRQHLATRAATATGLQVTALILSSVLVAATAVPIAQWLGSWRWPLALFSAATLVAALGWVVLTWRRVVGDRLTAARRAVPWRSGTAWLIVVVFCVQSLVFFGLATWLPAAYLERGWSEADAAALVAVLIAAGLPSAFAVGWLADRFGSRRVYLVGASSLALAACLGFIVLPDAAVLWAAVTGATLTALFSLALTMPIDVAEDPADVAPLTGLILGVGYLLAAFSPIALGTARDVLGTFTAGFALLAVACGLAIGASLLLSDARLGARRWAATTSAPAATPPLTGRAEPE